MRPTFILTRMFAISALFVGGKSREPVGDTQTDHFTRVFCILLAAQIAFAAPIAEARAAAVVDLVSPSCLPCPSDAQLTL